MIYGYALGIIYNCDNWDHLFFYKTPLDFINDVVEFKKTCEPGSVFLVQK